MRLLPFAVLLAASLASADPDKGAGAQEAKIGGKLYDGNNYREAAPHFLKAYELDPQPAYLFDAAQAYRFAKECASAAKYFRQFLDVAKQVKTENLDKVKGYIAEMDECAKPPPAPAAAPPLPPREIPVGPLPGPEVSDPGSTTRKVGIAVAVVGVVGLGVSGYYWKKVQDLNDDACHKDSTSCSPSVAQTENNDGETRARISIASGVVGGAALVGGIVLYVLGRNASNEPTVSLAPMRNGAALSFTF